jgi:hypothetical protein
LLKAPAPPATLNGNDVSPVTKPVPVSARTIVSAVLPVLAGITFGEMLVMVGYTTYVN